MKGPAGDKKVIVYDKTVIKVNLFTSELYGSKLFGHDIQAECGDFMNMGINYFVQETLLPPNFMVHDQIIVSCPKDTQKEDLDKIWGDCGKRVVDQFYPGLPVDFESELCYFFYK